MGVFQAEFMYRLLHFNNQWHAFYRFVVVIDVGEAEQQNKQAVWLRFHTNSKFLSPLFC